MLKNIAKTLAIGLCAAALLTVLPFQVLAKPKNLSKSVKVGDTVYFGKYEQDGNKDNGKEEIEWQVLSKKGGKALLISKHILDIKPYHKEWKDITWEESTLRKWLNKIFINNAFNEKEKKRIRKTEVVNKDNIKLAGDGKERWIRHLAWHTKGGNNTKDKVFLLSIDEVKIYFDSKKERTAEVTDYTITQKSKVWKETESETRRWFEEVGRDWGYWLRSPGDDQRHAVDVYNNGWVSEQGNPVNDDIEADAGVRPAIWVNL